MLNKELITQPIGPNGEFGSVTVAFVEGKLEAKVSLSPKGALDAVAKDINHPLATQAATAVETMAGLS